MTPKRADQPAGRPFGAVTRGTTNANRLRRVDSWIAHHCADALARADDPVVVDLGFGATPVTAVELRSRLVAVRRDVRVVGVEIDPVRVADAQSAAQPPGLTFTRGGFELAGLRPTVVRAMNVLRQYDESAVATAWATMTARLAPSGIVVEGTCDELGRLACWVRLDATGPVSLTVAARLATLDSPTTFAERLPKALIHRNVPGQAVHEFLRAFDSAWRTARPYAGFGARQRWVRAVSALQASGWPIMDRPPRWRLGEATIAWSALS
ncbi:MAG TPA: class I SAM-dependent methyltransferase [Micromonosporaceae bacterium]|nr:class I SAM-dependent methyltransferase [Micromonosporaceae bacterium]